MSENVNTTGDLNNLKAILIVIVGAIIILASLLWGFSSRQFISSAAVAKGVVTKLDAGGSHPEIQFLTNAGEKIEYPQGGLIGGYQVGDRVSVLYDEKNPQTAVVNSFGALWGFPLLAFILGIWFIIAGLLFRRA